MAVMERVVKSSGRPFVISRRFIERGFGNIKRSVTKYRQASHVIPHIVLTDLDGGACPVALRAEWGATDLPDFMLFRVAVRETESWLLGDRDGFADFASVAKVKISVEPEQLPDPKEALIDLVRRGRNKRLAAELVPSPGSAASIGPLYNEKLISFVEQRWDVEAAAAACPSLHRMRQRLASFLQTAG